MNEVLTLRLPKGSRRRLTELAQRKRQNVSQYVRDAIEAKLWVDALDETAALVLPKAPFSYSRAGNLPRIAERARPRARLAYLGSVAGRVRG